MATISITRKHQLPHRKAKAVAEKIAQDLEKRYGLEYEWSGDHLDFERPGLAGCMRVGKDSIALDVTLATPPSLEDLREVIAKGERDCFIGASLTAKPDYHWTVNGEDLA